jgi:hypothetical protein
LNLGDPETLAAFRRRRCDRGHAPADAAPPGRSERAAVEQRFALSFCYNQYRSQDDVTRCLAHYVR